MLVARNRRIAGISTLAVATAVGALAATHPTAAASALEAVESTVTCATTAACVIGSNTSNGPGVSGVGYSSYGVLGSSTGGAGVKGVGNTNYGAYGVSNKNYGVYGITQTGLAGTAGSNPLAFGYGVYGTSTNSSGGYGVYGKAASGYGIWGTTTDGESYGLVGYESDAGIGTYGGSYKGDGVQGASTNGNGVEGDSENGIGSYAQSTNTGTAMYAASNSGTALYASANTGYGIQAYSAGSVAVYARNSNGNGSDIEGSYIGLLGRAPASGGYPILATDQNGNDLFFVDGAGNTYYHGGLYKFADIHGLGTVKSFTPTSTQATVEDTGTAQLVGGSAAVHIDTAFAASIDKSAAYRVFITPDGDTRGLYVAAKTPNGFLVRETQGGHGTLAFDYRIVATAVGHASERMSFTTETTPHAALPAVTRITPGAHSALIPKR